MALMFTKLLTEKSTRNLPADKARSARDANNLTAILEPTVWTMWDPLHLTTL
jgi:hypothetical protein